MTKQNDGLFDMRTRAGRDQEVLAEVAISGGFSVSWAKENPQRSAAINRLQDQGRIRFIAENTGEFLRFVLTEPEKPKRSFWDGLNEMIQAWRWM